MIQLFRILFYISYSITDKGINLRFPIRRGVIIGPNMTNNIGALNEQPLHAALKDWYAGHSGQTEVAVEGYVIDVIKECQLIEIQTGNFSAIKTKLLHLVKNNRIKLVYPIAVQKWLLKLPIDNAGSPERRKSPKREALVQIFNELVSFPELLTHESFSLELAIIHEEEVRKHTGEKPWYRNGWVIVERRLIDVVDTIGYQNGSELSQLLPVNLPVSFTTGDIAKALQQPRWLAQKMAYCFRKMGTIECIGKKGRSNLYKRIC